MPADSAKSKLIKIGIECEQIENGSWGIARAIVKLLQEIDRRPELREKYRFFLYFKSRIPDLPFLKNPIFHCEVIRQPLPYKSFVLYYYVFLPMRLWFAGLDLMYFPNYMLPIIHFGKSLVLLTDDIYYEMRNSQQRPHHRLAYWVFGYWAVWFASRIMAISESSRRELIRLFPIKPERIAVNPLAVDPAQPMQGVTRTQPFLLCVGQALPRRHLRETIRAFGEIAPTFPGLELVIVGPDKYRPPLNKNIPGVIHFEHVSEQELATLYAHAQVVIYISDREAFGLPPVEALAYGTPAVVADKPVSREIFGDAAFFVANPDSVDSIATTLKDALTDQAKRQQIKAAAPAIVARYSWQAHTDRFLHIIHEISHA